MLLRWSLGLHEAAGAIERAVTDVIDEGVSTGDIAAAGSPAVSTAAFGDAVARRIREA
jgi:3-isopropylmalate dehydrogenase